MKTISFKNSFGDTLYGNAWEVAAPKAFVLIITGMAEHTERYNDFAVFLNKNGYSCASLDQYGQGNGKNGPLGLGGHDFFEKFVKTADEFILNYKKNHTNIPAYIFGHSMGSFMVQSYIEHYHNADKVVICGSNCMGGLGKVGFGLARLIVHKRNYNKQAELLNQLAVGGYAKAVKNADSPNDCLSYNKDNYRAYDNDPYSGYRCSNGFYYEFFKGLASLNRPKNLKTINKDLPIYIIAGDADPVGNNGKGPKKLDELYRKYGLNCKLTIYPNMRHEVLNETNHDVVYENVLDFYKAK